MFQHTAARRRLDILSNIAVMQWVVSTHSRPKAAGVGDGVLGIPNVVSTHSRPKAAGSSVITLPHGEKGFNTQPPEGGWFHKLRHIQRRNGFNTQPPEGGWVFRISPYITSKMFQHTAARRRLEVQIFFCYCFEWFQHTAARRRLGLLRKFTGDSIMFQHTAARRRLASPRKGAFSFTSFNTQPPEGGWKIHAIFICVDFVSTHSRPKAAGCLLLLVRRRICGFNTQPPEGGWPLNRYFQSFKSCFNTQPPEGGWLPYVLEHGVFKVSTHSRPKAAGLNAYWIKMMF